MIGLRGHTAQRIGGKQRQTLVARKIHTLHMLVIHIIGECQSQPVETVTRIKALAAIELQACQGTRRHLIGDGIGAARIKHKIKPLADNLRPQFIGFNPVNQLGATSGFTQVNCNFTRGLFSHFDGHQLR